MECKLYTMTMTIEAKLLYRENSAEQYFTTIGTIGHNSYEQEYNII